MDLLPQNMSEWMRGVKRDLAELKRHRHPQITADIGSLEQRVTDLETAVAALADDTGWTRLGSATIGDWSNFSMWRRVGEMVTVRFWVRWDGAAANQFSLTIGTLPSDARPTERIWQALYNSNTGTDGNERRGDVADTGDVAINAPSDGIVDNGNTLTGTVSFPRG